MSNEVKSVCPVCDKKFVKRAAAKAEKVELKKGDQFKANGKKFVCVKGGKKPVAKAVKGKAVEKIRLPKLPTVKEVKPEIVQVVCKHTIHPGDIVTWQGFTLNRIIGYCIRLLASALSEIEKKPAKKGKK